MRLNPTHHVWHPLVALALVASTALAQSAPPRVIPYSGRLERDGAPQEQSLEVKFCLLRAATHRCETASQVLWSETQQVQFHAGAFAVNLGSTQAIPDAVFREPELYIGVVLTPSATPVELDGKQRVLSAPYAVTAAQGTSLVASDELRVGVVRNATTAEPAGTGPRLYFSGGPVVAPAYGSDNSDPIWMARHNAGNNNSELRVNIGDDQNNAQDRLVVGVTPSGTFVPVTTIESNGNVTATGRVTASSLSITGSVLSGFNVLASGTTSPAGVYDETFVASSDGFVTVWGYGADNGSRGLVEGHLDPDGNGSAAEFVMAKDAYHGFTNSDVYVNDASISFPVPKGAQFRVRVASSSARTTYTVRWVALNQ